MNNNTRKLLQAVKAQAAQDGAGVNIHRLGGAHLQRLMNPYLMIDEINSDDSSDYMGGFPEHPHRGFETITYMKAGKMRHRDHMGNEGVIGGGDVQWMTTGRGVLHSEMPEQEQGLLHGFQIWLNSVAAEKMLPAQYKEILSQQIVEHQLVNNGVVRVIAGEVVIENKTLKGPMQNNSTRPTILDVNLAPDESITLELNCAHQAIVYIYEGNTDQLDTRAVGIYSAGQILNLKAGNTGAQLLVLSGDKINEPIAQYGPFVMNTHEELEQAFQDFQDPKFLSALG